MEQLSAPRAARVRRRGLSPHDLPLHTRRLFFLQSGSHDDLLMLRLLCCMLALYLSLAHGLVLVSKPAAIVLPARSIESSVQMIIKARTSPATKKKTTFRNEERSGKIEGLTTLAPLKLYLTGAALLWAVVGSIAQ